MKEKEKARFFEFFCAFSLTAEEELERDEGDAEGRKEVN